MLLTTEVMRFFVYICLFSMALLAVLFLRCRRLTIFEYLGWGLLALLLPIIGPYIVIAARPGRPRLT